MKNKMTRYSDIAKQLLVMTHGFNVFIIFLFIIDMTSDLRKLFAVIYLIVSNLIVYGIVKRFGKVWFK